MLSGKQKSSLRKLGQQLKPVFQIGKTGFTKDTLKTVEDFLVKKELVKISLLDTCPQSKQEIADLFDQAGIEVAGMIGKTILLYLENPKLDQKINLPK